MKSRRIGASCVKRRLVAIRLTAPLLLTMNRLRCHIISQRESP